MSNRTDIVVETDNAEGQVLLSASRVYDLTEDKTQDTINSEVGSSLTSLGNTLSHKADAIYDTASGDIASFPDGADGLPVKDLTVSIEPAQDLHGYDNPWPAGGGKNLLPLSSISYSDNGITVSTNVDSDGNIVSYKINGTVTADTYINIVTYYTLDTNTSYILSGAITDVQLYAQVSSSEVYRNYSNLPVTFTPSGTITNVTIYVSSGKVFSNALFYPMIRLASDTDPTFAPYSNICPISGWTGCKVTRTGKNLLNADNLINIDGANNVFVKNGGAYVFTKVGSGIANRASSEAPILIKKGTVFTFSYKCTYSTAPESSGNVRFLLRDGTYYTALSGSNWSDVSITITAPDDMVAVQIYYSAGSTGVGSVVNISDVQIELGSTATAYEPYTAVTIPISWQSSAGTVYGGTLDVTSGVLRVEWGMIEKNTSTMDNSNDWPGWNNSGIKDLLGINLNGRLSNDIAISNIGEGIDIGVNIYVGTGVLMLPKAAFGYNQDEWIAMAQDVQVCVKLGTPTTYQLTPQQLTTLLGQNNIWADCGPSTVEYPCDTKLYIQKINTPTDDDMVADANIASGKYFIINNNLYLSTAAILAGDPIKPGTNCTLTNLAAALNAINS